MSKLSTSTFFRGLGKTLSKNSPGILTGIGIAGMGTAVFLVGKATPKVLAKIDEVKQEENKAELTPVETIKVTWKYYIPAATTFVIAAGCILGANSVHAKRNAALAVAYKLTEADLAQYQEKVLETVGERKEKDIRDKVAKEKLDKTPVSKSEIVLTNKGTTLCFEPLSARYFKSDIDHIKTAVNEINAQILKNAFGTASLNDFYGLIGLRESEIGDDLGWNVERLLKLDFSSHVADNGEPALVLNYINRPEYEYENW
jgi:hypothetical protein